MSGYGSILDLKVVLTRNGLEGFLPALDDLEHRASRAEAAAEEARKLIADIWEHPFIARDLIQANGRGDPFAPYDAEIATLRAAAEEARQELEATKENRDELARTLGRWQSLSIKHERDLAEARQERDEVQGELDNAFREIGLVQTLEARIGELEAALRRVGSDIEEGRDRGRAYGLPLDTRAAVFAALQPTTEAALD